MLAAAWASRARSRSGRSFGDVSLFAVPMRSAYGSQTTLARGDPNRDFFPCFMGRANLSFQPSLAERLLLFLLSLWESYISAAQRASTTASRGENTAGLFPSLFSHFSGVEGRSIPCLLWLMGGVCFCREERGGIVTVACRQWSTIWCHRCEE